MNEVVESRLMVSGCADSFSIKEISSLIRAASILSIFFSLTSFSMD